MVLLRPNETHNEVPPLTSDVEVDVTVRVVVVETGGAVSVLIAGP